MLELNTVAEKYNCITSILQDNGSVRNETLGTRVFDNIILEDNLLISVQASKGHECEPKETFYNSAIKMYKSFEVAFIYEDFNVNDFSSDTPYIIFLTLEEAIKVLYELRCNLKCEASNNSIVKELSKHKRNDDIVYSNVSKELVNKVLALLYKIR